MVTSHQDHDALGGLSDAFVTRSRANASQLFRCRDDASHASDQQGCGVDASQLLIFPKIMTRVTRFYVLSALIRAHIRALEPNPGKRVMRHTRHRNPS